MAHRLDSARARLERAQHHLRRLERAVDDYRVRDAHSLWFVDDEDVNERTYHVQITRMPPAEWDVVLADCLHNYRSALDHVVWAALERFGTQTSTRCFPIHARRSSYRSSLPRTIGPTRRCGLKALLESFQPYKRNRRGDHDPLWLLHEWDRLAKHRELGAVATVVPMLTLSVTSTVPALEDPEEYDVAFDHEIDWLAPLEGDALRLRVRPLSHLLSEVEMEFEPLVSLGLKHPDPAHVPPIPMLSNLRAIRAAVLEAFIRLQGLCE